MPGDPVKLGPFTKGLHNSAGTGEYISNDELFELVNLEVDTDGSLANRPAITTLQWDSDFGDGRKRIIGTYQPSSGKRYLVLTWKSGTDYLVGLVDLNGNKKVVEKGGFTDYCACGVQYNDNYYVYPKPGTSDTGGYFDEEVWTTKDLPGHQAANCVIYKERMFAVAGIDSTTNTSRLYFSEIADPTDFLGTNYFDLNPGNGEKLTDITLLNNDLLLFKEHTTYRAGYSSNIAKMEISPISTVIGSPMARCSVVYNNTIYVLHDNSVYEMFNYAYNKVSSGLKMDRGKDDNISEDSYGLALFKDRVFVRYYGRLYVYNGLSGRWCEWETDKPFKYLAVLQDSLEDVAYGSSISTDKPGEVYSLIDSRIQNVEDETFPCRVVTKTYDFDVSYTYKVMFWWGMTIATLGDTEVKVMSPNAGPGYTWEQLSLMTWQDALDQNIKWSSATPVMQQTVVPAEIGEYSRKFLKFPKKIRFRQAFFQISSNVLPNNVGDAAVRIYDISVFLKSKEKVVQRTTA